MLIRLFGSLGKESSFELLLGSGCQFGSNYQSLGMGFSCCFDSMLDLSAACDSAFCDFLVYFYPPPFCQMMFLSVQCCDFSCCWMNECCLLWNRYLILSTSSRFFCVPLFNHREQYFNCLQSFDWCLQQSCLLALSCWDSSIRGWKMQFAYVIWCMDFSNCRDRAGILFCHNSYLLCTSVVI